MPSPKKAVVKSTRAAKKAGNPKTELELNSTNLEAQISVTKPKRHALSAEPSAKPFRADWRDAKAYPPPNCNNMALLAWEFLRRNKKYAQHVRQMLALPQGEYENGLTSKNDACLDRMVCTPEAKKGETVKKYRKRVKEESKGKDRGKIEKPALTFINRWMIEQPVPVNSHYDPVAVQFAPDVVKVYRNKEPKGRRVRLMMYPNEIAVRFRLDLPLEIQVKGAKQKLSRAINRYNEAAKKSRATNKGEEISSNGVARDKGRVEHDAHFWLRSYDASNETKHLLDDKDIKRKRALKSGPTEIQKQFSSEGKLEALKRGAVDNYKNAAKRRIEKLGYQVMVQVLEAAPPATLAEVIQKMTSASVSA